MDEATWELYWTLIYIPEKVVVWTWKQMMKKTVDMEDVLWYINLNTIKN
jgi:hypothetical protein